MSRTVPAGYDTKRGASHAADGECLERHAVRRIPTLHARSAAPICAVIHRQPADSACTSIEASLPVGRPRAGGGTPGRAPRGAPWALRLSLATRRIGVSTTGAANGISAQRMAESVGRWSPSHGTGLAAHRFSSRRASGWLLRLNAGVQLHGGSLESWLATDRFFRRKRSGSGRDFPFICMTLGG
jgi:hypothetical protein